MWLKKIKKIVKSKYFLAIILIFSLSIFLRIYGFNNRWGLASDDTREVLIAKEAIQRGEIPIIGPFSSAGPFVFGPIFYWIIIGSYIILPFTVTAPWIATILFSIFNVIILMLIGYFIGGKRLSLIIGIFAATSAQFSFRATVLTPHTYFATAACLLLLFFILLWKTKKLLYAFLMGLSLGLAINFHFQSLNYFLFLFAILFIPKFSIKRKIIAFLIMVIGVIFPMLPILVWDSQQNFANLNNILDYMFIGQYRIYMPNSWRLFIFNYFPIYWSTLVAGYMPGSLFIMFTTFIGMIYLLLKKKVSLLICVIGGIFLIMTLINRYYRGERFEGYMIYFAPFIFIFTSLVCNMFFEPKKNFEMFYKKGSSGKVYTYISYLIGIILIGIVVIGNLMHSWNLIITYTNNSSEIQSVARKLQNRYPNESFAVYDYKWQRSNRSYPLVLFLSLDKKISKNGRKIAVCSSNCLEKSDVIGEFLDVKIYNAEGEKNLIKRGFVKVNGSDIYDDLITRWTKKQKLTSTFSLPIYIKSRLGIN